MAQRQRRRHTGLARINGGSRHCSAISESGPSRLRASAALCESQRAPATIVRIADIPDSRTRARRRECEEPYGLRDTPATRCPPRRRCLSSPRTQDRNSADGNGRGRCAGRSAPTRRVFSAPAQRVLCNHRLPAEESSRQPAKKFAHRWRATAPTKERSTPRSSAPPSTLDWHPHFETALPGLPIELGAVHFERRRIGRFVARLRRCRRAVTPSCSKCGGSSLGRC